MKKRSVYVIGLVILLLALPVLNLTSCNSKPLSVSAKEGEAANGFTWENNYSEITITGYVGNSNSPTMPSYINGKPVTKIAKSAFEGYKTLETMKLSENLQTIESYAFENCESLKSITIPESVINIYSSAFWKCTNLTSFSFPNGVTKIWSMVLVDCSSLTSVVIPDSVAEIDSMAFKGSDNLKTVYYTGTREQWKRIKIRFGNEILETATIIYNYSK